MDGAPFFAAPIADQFITPEGALTIGIDGGDDDTMTITAASDNANITIFIPSDNRYARLNFSNIVEDTTVFAVSILVQLFETRAPAATQRFITLAENQVNSGGVLDPAGTPFYTDVPVRFVLPEFLFLTGDAVNSDGTGASGLGTFTDSFDPVLSFAGGGVLAMNNDGPDTNDIEWFITDGPQFQLNQVHTIFGQMITGQTILDKIINTPRDANNIPLSKPILDSVEIIQSPQDATLTLQVAEGFVGQAQITVTLDDGTGQITDQTFTVTSLGDKPVVTPTGELTATPEEPAFFDVVDDGGLPLDLLASSTPAGTQVVADDQTNAFALTVPQGFTGLARVTLTAVEAGFAGRKANTQIFRVITQEPGDPQVLGRAASDDLGIALAIFQLGPTLYVANGVRGLEVFDITDPAQPTLLGSVVSDGAVFRDVKVVGATAFVVFNNDEQGGLAAFDVSDPTNPTLVSFQFFPGMAISLLIDGTFAYVGTDDTDAATDDGALRIFDVSELLDASANTNNFTALGTIKDLPQGESIGHAIGLAKLGRTIFVSDAQNNGVLVLDAPSPDTISLIGRIIASPDPFGLAAEDDRLYVVDQGLGLLVFDVSQLNNVGLMGTFAISNLPSSLAVHSGAAAVATLGGFTIVDVTNPQVMSILYTFASPLGSGIPSINDNLWALPMGSDGIILMDGSNFRNTISFSGKFSINDDNGIKVTINVNNAIGRITTTSPVGGDILKLEILDSNEKTAVTVKTKGGDTTIGDIIFDGPAKSFTGKTTDLDGDFIAQGAILKVKLDDIDAGHVINIGPSTNAKHALRFTADQVRETALSAQIPIKAIKVASWLDQDDIPDAITADAITKLTSKGDFEPALIVAGHIKTVKIAGSARGNITARSAKSITIKINLLDAMLTFTLNTAGDRKAQALGKLKVTQKIHNVLIESKGNIGSIKAGAISHSTITVGLSNAAADLPDDPGTMVADDFDQDTAGKLAKITIKGIKNQPFALTDSRVLAWEIGTFKIGVVETDNAGKPFGSVAASIKSLTYRDQIDRFRFSRLQPLDAIADNGDFVVHLV